MSFVQGHFHFAHVYVCLNHNCQFGLSACISHQKGLSVLGTLERDPTKTPHGGQRPWECGKFCGKAVCITSLHNEPKYRTGRVIINNSSPKATPQEAKEYGLFSVSTWKLDVGTFLCCWWKCQLIQPLWETVREYLRWLNWCVPSDPAIALLGVQCLSRNVHQKIHTRTFLTTRWKD